MKAMSLKTQGVIVAVGMVLSVSMAVWGLVIEHRNEVMCEKACAPKTVAACFNDKFAYDSKVTEAWCIDSVTKVRF